MITDWNAAYRDRPYVEQNPHPGVVRLLETLKQAGATGRILDLGCGDGRHLVFLAKQGLAPVGLDKAFWGVRRAQEWAARERLEFCLVCADIGSLPWKAGSFDTVISIQVIHHQRLDAIRKTVTEVRRLLRAGGLFYFTVPKYPPKGWKGNGYEEIEPHTYVPADGFECGLPHHFFARDELLAILGGFEIVEIRVDSSHYWAVLARKAE
jgi:SAM-dependent methyltransferase